MSKWEGYGKSRDGSHMQLSYSWYGSWTTLYNLYADSLLCFHLDNTPLAQQSLPFSDPVEQTDEQKPIIKPPKSKPGFVPPHIYTMQSDWYHNVLQRYGLPLDSRHLYTKSDWEFFAAAVSSDSTRSEILQAHAKWLNETTTDRPMTDLYDTEGTGHFLGATFMNRPVIGGHFAFLTLKRACGGAAMEGLKVIHGEKQNGRKNGKGAKRVGQANEAQVEL